MNKLNIDIFYCKQVESREHPMHNNGNCELLGGNMEIIFEPNCIQKGILESKVVEVVNA